jgi:hypothetical protein
MIELVYYSEAGSNLTTQDIDDILSSARDFNSRNNITGCLLYYNNEFLQILEGEKEIVMELFVTIQKDKRHSNVMVLGTENKNSRLFSDWSMAFHKFDSTEIEKELFIYNISTFTEMYNDPNYVIDLFITMAKSIVSK